MIHVKIVVYYLKKKNELEKIMKTEMKLSEIEAKRR